MSELSKITAEEWETFRRCTFARRVFTPRPSLRARMPMQADDLPPPSRDAGEWHRSRPYHGEAFDPEEFELLEDDWDHEHCDVCRATVTEGMSYWPNVDPEAGHVDLCEACYPRVAALLGILPGN